MNKVDQKMYSQILIPLREVPSRANRLLTLTLPITLEGDSEGHSLDECIKSTEGLKVFFVCNEDPLKALSEMPKVSSQQEYPLRRMLTKDMDARIVYPPSMPKYLRIDKDV
jgi:hypothetical protein